MIIQIFVSHEIMLFPIKNASNSTHNQQPASDLKSFIGIFKAIKERCCKSAGTGEWSHLVANNPRLTSRGG